MRIWPKIKSQALRKITAAKAIARQRLTSARETIKDWTSKKVVTLDLDGAVLRLVEAKGLRVRKWASGSFETSKVEEGGAPNQNTLGAAVKKLLLANNIKTKKIIVGVDGHHSISRVLPMPTIPERSTTQEAILNAASEAMPLPKDQLYLSWKPINVIGGEPEVLAIGVPRDVVDEQIRTLKKAGIKLSKLEPKSVALSKAVGRQQALILNIEPSSFDVVVIVNSIPVVTHTTVWNGSILGADDKVEQLAVSLELALEFYNLHHPEVPLETTPSLFITGQLSTDAALIDKLNSRLRYDTMTLTPPLECPAQMPASQYAANIGLVMNDSTPAKKNQQDDYALFSFDLLPQIYRAWRPSLKQVGIFASLAAAVGLLFPFVMVTNEAMNKTATLQARYTSLNNDLQRKQLEIKNREPLQAVIDDYHIMTTTMAERFIEDLQVIREIAGKLGTRLGSITHEGDTITVNCEADTYVAFRKFAAALKESGRFAEVVPPQEGFPFRTSGLIKLKPMVRK